ncbi:hypothetical protein [Carnobacterium sp. ISL-102]|uniref:hypothetical protein n=1 Tax=Carnobacterium sp. ISL-102 TaxID=2819142 RepID=UPI001BECF85F|nr:hypothetical protein [Carnobacterium sp. ISL-102]MBT2732033.1 hypothetical protein [Carnobacterium sp. ISL-102]
MEIAMNLEQATYHLEKTKPLTLKEVTFKFKPTIKEQKRLFRSSLHKLTIIAEVNNQVYEFLGYDLNHKLISQLKKDPSRFLVGAEPPFLCGTNWPDSALSEVVEKNNVPLDSLIITDGTNVAAIIYEDEISVLINWFKILIS